MKKKYPKPLCSRVDCPNVATARLQEHGHWHKLCTPCWNTAMDMKDKQQLAEKIADRKTMAGGT